MTHVKYLGLSLIFLAGCAPASPPPAEQPADISAPATQLLTKTSADSFEQTASRLRAGIEKRPLKLFAEVDHAAGAASADLTLAPSTLFIFGNPKGGTPLMTRNPQMGIVLPLKMHVYQTGDVVTVSYPDIASVAKTYGLDPSQQPVPNIANMLDGLAAEAAGN